MGQLSEITQSTSRLSMESKTPQEKETAMWLNGVRNNDNSKKEILIDKIEIYGCKKEVDRQYEIAEKEIPKIIGNYFENNTSAIKDVIKHVSKIYVSAVEKANERVLTNDSSQKSGKDDLLRTYGTHTMPHIQCVMEKANILIQNRSYLTNDNIKNIVVSCLYHDTGMADSRNLALTKYEEAKENNGDDFYRNKENTEPKSVSDYIRSYHSLTSGIEVLKDRKSLEKLGVNVDLCAMVVASHSKSNSGLKDFKKESFENFIENISKLVDMYNTNCSEEEKISFNKDEFLEKFDNPEWLAEFKELAKIVSYADAFTNCYDTKDIENTNQLGENYDVIYIENPPIELMNNEEKEIGSFISNMFLFCDGKPIPHSKDLIGEGFLIGEHNITCSETKINDELVISIDIIKGNSDPYLSSVTSECIGERILETIRFSSVENKQAIEIIIDSNTISDISPEVFANSIKVDIEDFIISKFEEKSIEIFDKIDLNIKIK